MEAIGIIYTFHFVFGSVIVTFGQFFNCRLKKLKILLFLYICNIFIFTFFFGVLGPFLIFCQIASVNNFTLLSFAIYLLYIFMYIYTYYIYNKYISSLFYITAFTLCTISLFNTLYISASWHPEAHGFTWSKSICLDENIKYYYISSSLESICIADSKNKTKVLLKGSFSNSDFLWPFENNYGTFDVCLIKRGLDRKFNEIIVVDQNVSALFTKFNHPTATFFKINDLKIPDWGGFLPSLSTDPSVKSNIFISARSELNGNLSNGLPFSCGFYSPFFMAGIKCPVLINNKIIALSVENKIVFIDTESKSIKSEDGLNPLFFLKN